MSDVAAGLLVGFTGTALTFVVCFALFPRVRDWTPANTFAALLAALLPSALGWIVALAVFGE